MNPGVLLALQILQQIPMLIASGQSVMQLVNHGTSTLQSMIAENREPTAEEWKILNDTIAAASATVQGWKPK